MPNSITLFERLAYVGLVLGIISSATNAESTPTISLAFVATTTAISVAFQLLFIWLIARKRKNWARWVWIVLNFVGLATAVYLAFLHLPKLNGIVGIAIYGLLYFVSMVSAILLLTSESAAWFRRRSDEQIGAFD